MPDQVHHKVLTSGGSLTRRLQTHSHTDGTQADVASMNGACPPHYDPLHTVGSESGGFWTSMLRRYQHVISSSQPISILARLINRFRHKDKPNHSQTPGLYLLRARHVHQVDQRMRMSASEDTCTLTGYVLVQPEGICTCAACLHMWLRSLSANVVMKPECRPRGARDSHRGSRGDRGLYHFGSVIVLSLSLRALGVRRGDEHCRRRCRVSCHPSVAFGGRHQEGSHCPRILPVRTLKSV